MLVKNVQNIIIFSRGFIYRFASRVDIVCKDTSETVSEKDVLPSSKGDKQVLADEYLSGSLQINEAPLWVPWLTFDSQY